MVLTQAHLARPCVPDGLSPVVRRLHCCSTAPANIAMEQARAVVLHRPRQASADSLSSERGWGKLHPQSALAYDNHVTWHPRPSLIRASSPSCPSPVICLPLHHTLHTPHSYISPVFLASPCPSLPSLTPSTLAARESPHHEVRLHSPGTGRAGCGLAHAPGWHHPQRRSAHSVDDTEQAHCRQLHDCLQEARQA
jgi:hypothetical protein